MYTLVSGNITLRTATTAAQLAPVAASAGMKEYRPPGSFNLNRSNSAVIAVASSAYRTLRSGSFASVSLSSHPAFVRAEIQALRTIRRNDSKIDKWSKNRAGVNSSSVAMNAIHISAAINLLQGSKFECGRRAKRHACPQQSA